MKRIESSLSSDRQRSRRLGLLCLCLLGSACAILVGAGRAGARTWVVEQDPNQPIDQIGQVVIGAGSGDTIIVGPGTYHEHIPVIGKSITLIGRDGATSTILDGSQPIDGREGSVLYCDPDGVFDLHAQGLTFTHGSGYHRTPHGYIGGGICWYKAWREGIVTIRGCDFVDNVVQLGMSNYGCGIGIPGATTIGISDCSFTGNHTNRQNAIGGGIYIDEAEQCVIQRCTFNLSNPLMGDGDGAAMHVWANGEVQILDSYIESTISIASSAVEMRAIHGLVHGNTFVATDGRLAAVCEFATAGGTGPYPPNDFTITGNKWWVDTAGQEPCIHFYVYNGSLTFSDNGLVRCPQDMQLNGGPLEFSRNVLYYSQAVLGSSTVNRSTCVVTWPTAVQDGGWGTLQTDRNVVEDPLFCADAPGEFSVASNSPCISDPLLPNCGVIGGVTVGCGPIPEGACCMEVGPCQVRTAADCSTEGGRYQGDGVSCVPNPCLPVPVENSSWGRIKARFH